MFEGCVLVRAFEIFCKIQMARRAWAVFLEDNGAVTHALAKGRAKIWSLNLICRRGAALEFISEISCLAAWCVTERMPVDRLSRERVAHRTFAFRV